MFYNIFLLFYFRVIYNLHDEYRSPGKNVEAKTIPWLPGDSLKKCVHHKENKTIPLLFHPKEEDPNEIHQVPTVKRDANANSSRQKNKKSKKRRKRN